VQLEHIAQELLKVGSSPPRICWGVFTQQQASSLARSLGDHSNSASTAASLTVQTTPDVCAFSLDVKTLDVILL